MRRWVLIWLIAFVAIGLLVFWLAVSAAFLQHWIAVRSGTDYLICKGSPCPNQEYYNWWSGPGSDLGELTLITAVLASAFTVYRSHECHTSTCHWPAHHTTADGYRLCKKCIGKPVDELELHEIHSDHRERTMTTHKSEKVGGGPIRAIQWLGANGSSVAEFQVLGIQITEADHPNTARFTRRDGLTETLRPTDWLVELKPGEWSVLTDQVFTHNLKFVEATT